MYTCVGQLRYSLVSRRCMVFSILLRHSVGVLGMGDGVQCVSRPHTRQSINTTDTTYEIARSMSIYITPLIQFEITFRYSALAVGALTDRPNAQIGHLRTSICDLTSMLHTPSPPGRG